MIRQAYLEIKTAKAKGRYPKPTHIRYRGRVRRVYGVLAAIHGGHRHYVLRYQRHRQPHDAASIPWGPRGQAHCIAVLVRADHCQPLMLRTERTGRRGRPRFMSRMEETAA